MVKLDVLRFLRYHCTRRGPVAQVRRYFAVYDVVFSWLPFCFGDASLWIVTRAPTVPRPVSGWYIIITVYP